jgi:hypothetical protein
MWINSPEITLIAHQGRKSQQSRQYKQQGTAGCLENQPAGLWEKTLICEVPVSSNIMGLFAKDKN